MFLGLHSRSLHSLRRKAGESGEVKDPQSGGAEELYSLELKPCATCLQTGHWTLAKCSKPTTFKSDPLAGRGGTRL